MRNKQIVWVWVAMLIASIPARLSFGWIATGHMVVALVAWEDLTPRTRAAVIGLLKQHPRYEKDLLEDLPDGATAEEEQRYVFAKSATWPDAVRSPDHPMHATHNHPAWHFIDIPYDNGVAATALPPVEGPGPHNIVEALEKFSVEIKDPSVKESERALDICWIVHLVGDIHQPLHAVSMYSPEHPDGDKGGNDDEVLRDPPFPNSRENLHFVWDALPGEFHSQMMDRFEAIGLRADPHFTRDQFKSLLEVKDFMAWAKESYQLAIDDAYLNGKLKTGLASHRGSRGAGGEPVPGLPPGYLEKSEIVAMHQVALAGYRLADLLNAAFDPKS